MEFRVSVIQYGGDGRPVPREARVTVDAGCSVGEVASCLVRAGAGSPDLLAHAVTRRAPLTLRVTYPGGAVLILDTADAVVDSGMRSGSTVEPVLEAASEGERRTRSPIAVLAPLAGVQRDLRFLATGETTIGRDRGNRIRLHDPGVSRRHAVLRSRGGLLEIEDLGSGNGTAVLDESGRRRGAAERTIRLTRSAVVEFGTIPVRVEPVPHRDDGPTPESSVRHLQAPHVDPVFTAEPVELPAPAEAAEPSRFPLLAMVAPLVMGGVLALTTRSPLSVVFIALSPLIMIGTWLDARLTRRRAARAHAAAFASALSSAEAELRAGRTVEQQARDAESPPPTALIPLPRARTERLWSRRPEHRAFLELRLGCATLPSRRTVAMPARGSIPAEAWEQLARMRAEYADIPSVPVLERLDRCGSLGVAGDRYWAPSVARALLVQLLAGHSPADLVVTAFADSTSAEGEWSWLAWLPHVGSAHSPLDGPQLAADPRSAGILLTALEGLIAERAGGRVPTVRSRMAVDAAEAPERSAAVDARGPVPAVLVCVLADDVVDRSRLVGLAEDGADAGVHVLWIADRLGGVPAACRTVVVAGPEGGQVHFVRQGAVRRLTSADVVDLPNVERFARELAPIVDAGARVLDETDLPRSVALPHLLAGDVLDGGDGMLRNWERTDSLAARWRPGAEREAGRLAAVVGQGSAGAVELDLRAQGPHALVGGTTGSGKSEFLQSWILSLAAEYAPDRLTFLLVDYKGGSAFAECVELPHTVGLVTDLNPHLVRRALTSLRAELRHRERLLASKKAKDLIALERRGDPEAPPALVIVIDEFKALATEIPEFLDGVVDIAQRGRSLGLHLIMGTQRPAGVITDTLRANTNLRVCLRTADPADSSDVIGVPDAAGFSPDAPGRAAVRVGSGRLIHLQTGFIGGRSDADRQESAEIRDLGFGEHAPWPILPEEQDAAEPYRGPKDIEVMVEGIRRAADRAGVALPRRPWLDHLPTVLPRTSGRLAAAGAAAAAPGGAAAPDAATAARGGAAAGIVLGLEDHPERQRQTAFAPVLAETGAIAIFGGPGSGRSTALISAACALIDRHPDALIYGIDAGGGGLRVLTALPNTGDVVPSGERDRVVRLLGDVKERLAARLTDRRPAPPLLLLVDGAAALRDAYELPVAGADAYADLVELAAGGRTVGIHVVLTAERPTALSTALASTVTERLVLRQAAESDYALLGVPAEVLRKAAPGRAVRVSSGAELQLVASGTDGTPEDTAAAIRALAAAQSGRGVRQAPGIPPVPVLLPRSRIAREAAQRAPFAIDTIRLRPVAPPARGMLLVSGPAGSGRSTAIRSLLEAIGEHCAADGERLDGVLFSPRRSALRDLPSWREAADTPGAREDAIARLTRALGGAPVPRAGDVLQPLIGLAAPDPLAVPVVLPVADAAAGSGSDAELFPAPGARGVVVIEDVGGFEGSGDERALAALLKLLRRSDLLTIVEGENATLSAAWELAAPLRGTRWILALQPDANDVPSVLGTSFPHARRADFPPGRGLLIENGRTTGVHVAWPDTAAEPPPEE